jgi:hypothetical protein
MFAAACGDSSPATPDASPDALVQVDHGTGSVTGTIRGQQVVIVDAVSGFSPSQGSTPGSFAGVMMSTAPQICSDVKQHIDRAGSTTIVMQLLDATATRIQAPTAPGTYVITTTLSGPVASYGALTRDATCGVQSGTPATSGTVTLTSVVGEIYAGTFDVTLESGDHVTGTFSPGACPALRQSVGSPTCQ